MEFYKRCQKCLSISGFDLPEGVISKNEKYFCQNCRKESELNKWKNSTRKDFLSQEEK